MFNVSDIQFPDVPGGIWKLVACEPGMGCNYQVVLSVGDDSWAVGINELDQDTVQLGVDDTYRLKQREEALGGILSSGEMILKSDY